MSRADGVLVCVVSRRPWEMFDAGIKGAEYRGDKWRNRIMESATEPWPWHTLRLPLGYASSRPILDIPIRYIDWGLPNPEWTCGIIAPEECFRIWVDLPSRRRIA